MRYSLEKMVETLNEVGYSVIAILEKEASKRHVISTIIIQKTHPNLNFPIVYDSDRPVVTHKYWDVRKTACYAPDPRYMEIPNEVLRQKAIDYSLARDSESMTFDYDEPTIIRPTDPNNALNKLYEKFKTDMVKRRLQRRW